MKPRFRTPLANAALALASVSVGLGALELAARWVEPRGQLDKGQDERSRYIQADPLLGWRMRSGARVRFERSEYSVEVAINRLGLRDVERSYAAAPGTFRVLALGDSFIEGYSVPLEATVTQVLEKRLTTPTRPVEVLNAGTTGYSTDQEYLFYREEGVRYSPRVVLLFFFYNDVLFNTRGNYWSLPKPLLAERGAGLDVVNAPLPSPKPRPARKATRTAPHPSRAPRSAALAWARQRLARGAPAAYNALARLGLWNPLTVEEPSDEMKVYKRRALPEIQEAWAATKGILAALRRDVESHGGHLLVAYVPSGMEVDDAAWQISRFRFAMQAGRWDRGLVLTRLERIGRESGIPILDLTSALRQAHSALFGRVFFPRDGHWTARGHLVVAREVERALREQGWLPQ